MAFQIVWSQTAVEDLKGIVQYIALDDPDASAKLAGRIIQRIETASELPFSNRTVPEKGKSHEARATGDDFCLAFASNPDKNKCQ